MHVRPEVLDALAHEMAEEPARSQAEAHVASCTTCERALAARQREARLLAEHIPGPKRPRRQRALKFAAAATSLFAVAWLALGVGRWQTTPRESPSTAGVYRLNDGTEIVASRAPTSPEWRIIKIEPGDYYFNVAPSDTDTFRIVTETAEVQVLGTRFRVLYEERVMQGKLVAVLGVAVVSGAVMLLNSNGSVRLGPNEAGEVVGESAPAVGVSSMRPTLTGESPQARIVHLEQALAKARREVDSLRRRQGAAPDSSVSDPKPMGASTSPSRDQSRVLGLLRRTYTGTASMKDMMGLGQLLKDSERVAELRTHLEKRIAENPRDVNARLGVARLEAARLHTERVSITERAQIMARVSEQIEEVLKNDPANWEALYQKAVGVSHSAKNPAQRAEAIRQFEALRAYQEKQRPEPRFVSTYVELARVHLAEQNKPEALTVIDSGLAIHDDSDRLKKMLGRVR